MHDPRPFIVTWNGRFLFVIHAYSEQQVRTLVAARLADTTGVRIVAPRKGSPRWSLNHSQHARDGLRLSHAKGDQTRHGTQSDGVRVRTDAHLESLPLDGLQQDRSHLP
jgi:hypothetical protein